MEDAITIRARFADVLRACQFVEAAADYAGLDARAVHHCQLACDEACTNIIEHGYGGERADQVIDVACVQTPHDFQIIITDDSAFFDPLTQLVPDPDVILVEQNVGGWGLYFIKKLMDDVTYDAEDGRNRLILIKFLPYAPGN